MLIRLFLIFILTLSFVSCSDHPSDPRLTQIELLSTVAPVAALDSLVAVDYPLLSEADRHYYDFLSVKVADKAYVTHTSDSLILRVIDYESRHKSSGRYPEALYYGGRVYSDLGDSPSALRYFHEAIRALPSDTADLPLRSRILSQTGRLLESLSFFDEALPYLYETLNISRNSHDSIDIIYDLQLLGCTFLRSGDYKKAEGCFRESLTYCEGQPPHHRAKSRMYQAAVKHKQGDIDSALYYIRNTLDAVKPMVRNSVLGYASTIYQQAGILDTAYMYAKDLISNPDPTHREIGYQVLLSPELLRYSHPDTLVQYIARYRTVLVNYYNESNMQLTINRQNLYNYQLHEARKAEAEQLAARLKLWIAGCVLLLMLLALLSLYLKNKSKTNIIMLQQALTVIDRLRRELETAPLSNPRHADGPLTLCPAPQPSEATGTHTAELMPSKATVQALRESLKNELIALYETAGAQTSVVSPLIMESAAYQKIQEHIHEAKIIKDNDPLWGEIEQAVIDSSPKFKSNLRLLTSGNLTTIDLHTALLIKCGIKPAKMTLLLGRSHGAIVSRRETLCVKILGEKKGTKVIDGIIRLL